jgi:tRNA-2-methylthio-N6-dimethylallyladenosine synthase
MNRQHSADEYRRMVDRLRQARADLAFSSDFIVGFPGETDEDLDATFRLIDDVGFAQAYSFKYSPRPGTPAAALETQVPEPVKDERLARLHRILEKQAASFNAGYLGQCFDILLDRPGRHPGQLLGRTPYMQSVFVTAPAALRNTVQRLRIVESHTNSLGAILEGERACA